MQVSSSAQPSNGAKLADPWKWTLIGLPLRLLFGKQGLKSLVKWFWILLLKRTKDSCPDGWIIVGAGTLPL